MLDVLVIVLSLFLLMYLAYKGISVIILTPILALLAVLMTGDGLLLPTYTEVFMTSVGNYVKTYFPIFLLGAIFGKVMDKSGSAQSVSNFVSQKLGKDKAILAVILSCAVLTYGGVSLFVVAFAVYPIATSLFREAQIPKRFIPAAIALGSFTFTMTALPGTPQIQNAIPSPYFNTNAYAAPVLGLVGGAIMFFGGLFWLTYRSKKAKAAGEGYGSHKEKAFDGIDASKVPPFLFSIIPIILVLVVNYLLLKMYFPSLNPADFERYNITLSKVTGNWSLIISLIIAILSVVILNFKYFSSMKDSSTSGFSFVKSINDVKDTLNDGASSSLGAIVNTACSVGYGNVISSLAAFEVVKTALIGVSKNPLISEAISVSSLAGITGSASGGLSIALGALGETYLAKASEMGINPEVLHRIAVMACGGLDSLPHNGAVITLLAVTGLTHKDSYLDIGMCTVIIPILSVVACIILASMGVV